MITYFVNKIYDTLAKAIDSGYKSGIKSIVNQNKKKFTFRKDPIFNIDYTATDLEALLNFKMNAFLVAGVGSYELQQELKQSGVNLMESDIPDFESFELEVRQKMLNYGIGLSDQPPGGWIKQNIDTAIKNSISAAKFNRATDKSLKGLYSAFIYHTQEDERVRSEHAILDMTVYDVNDENAQKIIPPIDWGCRCYVEYITKNEAADMNILSPDETSNMLREVPEEFRYNPGNGKHIWRRWLQQKYHDMPPGEYKKIKNLLKNKFKN